MTELRDIPNPYDFANPVFEERNFFGRSSELSDLIYYLNHTRTTRRPIHLALVGARASGKTSFLNVADAEARRRDACTVRINLNEGDVTTDLAFFRKLIHSAIMASYKAGGFGGTTGASYLAYLEMTATHVVKDIEQVPFISAIQIAFAQKSGNNDFLVPDETIVDDLKRIYDEIKVPLIILLDECNVLSKNRIIVEKLRNVFMNMEGYMLIMAATDSFFPVMDDIFSPIMRQFRRIDIGPFKTESDVSDCIRHPLQNSGISRSEVRKLVSNTFVRDVDVLSGRRPYEIQLICHSLFRHTQSGVSRIFSLDLKTLESIQRELASGQKVEERPIIRAARLTKRITFSALNAISGSSELLTRQQWWNVEYLFNGNSRWTKDKLFSAVEDLISSGIVAETSSGISFAGDDFDRLYIKYIARQKGANINSLNQPFEVSIFNRLVIGLSDFKQLQPIGALQAAEYIDSLASLSHIIDPDYDASRIDGSLIDPLSEDILTNFLAKEDAQHVKAVEIFFTSDLGSCQSWFLWSEPEYEIGLRKLEKRLAEMVSRAAEIGFGLEYKIRDLKAPTPSVLLARVAQIGNEQLATRLGAQLMSRMPTIYLDERDTVKAKHLVETAFRISGSRMTQDANNVGYLYMACGEFDEAKLWFLAAKQYLTDDDKQLLEYNMGVLAALTHDYARAIFHFNESIRSQISMDAACVYKLSIVDGHLVHEEVLDPPSISSLAKNALEVLDRLQN